MRRGKIAVTVMAVSMSALACILDMGRLGAVSPTVDTTAVQKTESVITQAFQEALGTAVAATVSAWPTWTPLPTEMPKPTITNTPSQDGTPLAGSTRVPSSDRFDIPVEGQPFLGPENAPIVMVEFGDHNCGYCRMWYLETFSALLDAYPGQIRFVYRDFAILSDESFNAAVAAQCAYKQGAFWEYHERLFTRAEAKGLQTYLLFAQELGLESQDFQACLESEWAAEEVMSDMEFASGIGIQGTPTFFINGIPLVGAQPVQNFKKIIEAELVE